jgi:hypothetical protein
MATGVQAGQCQNTQADQPTPPPTSSSTTTSESCVDHATATKQQPTTGVAPDPIHNLIHKPIHRIIHN